MQPFPIPFEPTNLTPCMTLRSRREVNNFDAVNSRLVEHWQTDGPAMQYSQRNVSGAQWWMDMNPTPSRLYRENLLQSQPFVPPTANSQEVKDTINLNQKINDALIAVQNAKTKEQLAIAKSRYDTLLEAQKQLQVDTLASNPYFKKYDVAGDSRNIIRELRGVVTEDVVDRGVRESQKMLAREMQSRWLPARYAEETGLDQLTMLELMRPRLNDMSKNYR
jgi:hypothetical protein